MELWFLLASIAAARVSPRGWRHPGGHATGCSRSAPFLSGGAGGWAGSLPPGTPNSPPAAGAPARPAAVGQGRGWTIAGLETEAQVLHRGAWKEIERLEKKQKNAWMMSLVSSECCHVFVQQSPCRAFAELLNKLNALQSIGVSFFLFFFPFFILNFVLSILHSTKDLTTSRKPL